jgi:hypothetical protein
MNTKIGYENVEWINVAYRNQHRALMNTVMNFWIPLKMEELLG